MEARQLTKYRAAGCLLDGAVVERVLAGETELFEILMRRYNQRVYRVVRAILGDDQRAEDAMQEAYLRAFSHLRSFDGSGPFPAWLTRIAVNEALRARRDRTRWFDQGAVPDQIENGTDEPMEDVSRRDMSLRNILADAIERLPPAQRTVFVLRQLEQLSVNETAAALDISASNVKTTYHRARLALRSSIESRLGNELTDVYSFDGARCDRIVEVVMRHVVRSW